MYNILNCTKGRPANEQKWLRHFDYLNTVTWKKMYAQIHHYIKDPKLIWFQFRIFHHILTTNKFAYKIWISDSPLCIFWDSEEETIVHVLWECDNMQRFLHHIETWLQSYDFQFQFEKLSFLLVNSMERNESNLIMSLKGHRHDWGQYLFTKIIWQKILIEFSQKVIQKCTNHFGKDCAINRAEITH